MKNLVKTTSPVHLVDPTNGQEIHWNRPSVVIHSSFVDQRIASGVLELIDGKVSDKATDGEFAQFLKDSKGDVELAVSSFLSKFGPEAEKEVEKKEEPKTPAKAK